MITILSFLGYIVYVDISLIPNDLLNLLRPIRDTVQEIFKSAEQRTGVFLKAKISDSLFIVKNLLLN